MNNNYNSNCHNGKCNNAIEGVNCDVSECVHHDGSRNCTASCICVENKETETGTKTCCGTFVKR